ncbi:MAG TPA: ABC transporter ATP-binding protein [Tepidiformaceae bacterium]|nr:ABC transporter ATP-binding protein [Tepidiformaceae bacterium]
MAAILIEGLEKRFGAVHALRGIDIRVEEGELFGFLGPNGAGKSTTIRILLDLIRPSAGHAGVFGLDCQVNSVEARAKIGYLPSDPQFPKKLTAHEVFTYAANVRGLDVDRAYLSGLIERLDLDTSRPVSTLSRGNRQKVGLVQALLSRPPLLILDEPTTGLDPLVQEEVEAILREVVAEGRTVFFSSHILLEVQALCSRAAIVRSGRIVEVFDLAEQRRIAPVHVKVRFAEPLPEGSERGAPVPALGLSPDRREATLEVRDGFDPLIRWLAGTSVETLEARPRTLEEAFVGFYRDDSESEGPK